MRSATKLWLLLAASVAACGGGSEDTPPDDAGVPYVDSALPQCPIPSTGRPLVEELLRQLVDDTHWVAKGTREERVGFAISVPGLGLDYRGIASESRSCTQAVVCDELDGMTAPFWQGHSGCRRIRCEGELVKLVDVYLTTKPATSPDDRAPLQYDMSAPPGHGAADPNPYVTWRVDQTNARQTDVSADIERSLRFSPAVGTELDVGSEGRVTATVREGEVESMTLRLTFPRLAAGGVPVLFSGQGLQGADGSGTLTLGAETLATVHGEPLAFRWRDPCRR